MPQRQRGHSTYTNKQNRCGEIGQLDHVRVELFNASSLAMPPQNREILDHKERAREAEGLRVARGLGPLVGQHSQERGLHKTHHTSHSHREQPPEYCRAAVPRLQSEQGLAGRPTRQFAHTRVRQERLARHVQAVADLRRRVVQAEQQCRERAACGRLF